MDLGICFHLLFKISDTISIGGKKMGPGNGHTLENQKGISSSGMGGWPAGAAGAMPGWVLL